MEIEFLKALVVVFGVSALSVFVLHRLRVPPLVGFIAAGVLMGPHTLGIIEDVREIEILADIGVILLLFVVGIEFSLDSLMKRKKVVLLGGGGQIALTIALSTALAYPFAGALNASVFMGFLIALSSTAIVFKMLLERGEMDTPHGRVMAGVLIFQDLCVVPLMLLIPALSGEGVAVADLMITVAKAAGIIALVLMISRWVVPGLLHQIVHTRSRELFIITVILMCLSVALLTSRMGLSLALGAFLAGLAVSESEYAFEATAEILPLKDSFMGLFFVSIGMLVDTSFLVANLPGVLLAVAGIFLLKALAATGSLLIINTPPRTAVQSGMGLAQVGEFSFVLAAAGRQTGLLSPDFFQMFLSASVITMALTPFMLGASPAAAGWFATRGPLRRLGMISEEADLSGRRSDHVLIVGFGFNGRNLARTLRESGIPYAVLELNSDTVREGRKKGEPIFFGDGTSKEILHKLGIETARLLVVAISDPASSRKIVAMGRRINPDIRILVRTRYLAEVEDLRALGADEVIPEEFETSVEIFSRVLHHYGVPANVIADRIEDIRKDSYKAFRTAEPPRGLFAEHPMLSGIETETYKVRKGSNLSGHSLLEIQLRKRTGATVLAVKRGDDVHHGPGPDFVFRDEDILLLAGKREDINKAVEYMESEKFLTWKYHT
ncbi:MAG: monovalent cation:proton antiporter-2 (CPA2) family protein [Thermodesulfovibrionales bacterium]